MNVIIFARPELLAPLRRAFERCGAEIIAESSDPAHILACVRRAPADLLLLDSDLGLHSALGAAREAQERHGSQVAFLSPNDAIVGDVLLGLDPVNLLPAAFGQEDIAALLAKARARAEAASSARQSRAAEHSAGVRLELVALASMLLAVMVGYFLPGGWAVFEAAGHKAYYIVIGFALISLACLLSLRRPLLAGVHTALIALVTILPTR